MPIAIEFSGSDVGGVILAPFRYFGQFFVNGGWIVLAIGVLFLLWELHMYYIQNKFAASIKYVVLAIDVPREVVPNLKKVEHIYAQMFGIASSPNWVEKYFEGRFQLAISLELVSIGGYVQFLIRTPEGFRDLVEAAVYAQYPEVQITEVEDYTKGYPSKFPNDTHDVYGSGITFAKPSAYPIRTYVAFEHGLSGEFADPMASLLEVLSKIGQGEQIWIQMVIRPIREGHWLDEAAGIIKKIIGEKSETKDVFGPLANVTQGVYQTVTASLLPPAEAPKKKEDNKEKNQLLYLTAGEKNVLEGIQMKLSKSAYQTKFRYVYIAEKGLANKGLGISAVFGALNQFAAQDMNAFKPDSETFTKSNFILFNKYRFSRRQHNLMYNYRNRAAGSGIILNIEELATVFHFPTETVKAPLLKKTDAKRGEPPTSLPIPNLGAALQPVDDDQSVSVPEKISIPDQPLGEAPVTPRGIPISPSGESAGSVQPATPAPNDHPPVTPPASPPISSVNVEPADDEPRAPTNLPFA